jgi:hypothetical protein
MTPDLFPEPQWKQVLNMLKTGPKSTADFCSTYGLAAEYRRAITDLRKKGYTVKAERQREGSWLYKLLKEKP